eukprot:5531222-Prymnesium_polylepis.1
MSRRERRERVGRPSATRPAAAARAGPEATRVAAAREATLSTRWSSRQPSRRGCSPSTRPSPS